MPQKPKPLRRRGAARVIAESAGTDDSARAIVERPDGFYWLAPGGHQEFGPFDSREAALADRNLAADEAPEPGETLQEAERDIGIADWIDPDTGEPAEGLSPPRLEPE